MSDELTADDLFGEPDVKEKVPSAPELASEPIIDQLGPSRPPQDTDTNPTLDTDDKISPKIKNETHPGEDIIPEESASPASPADDIPSPHEDGEVKSKIPPLQKVIEPPDAAKEPTGTINLLDIKIAEFEKRKDFVVFKVTSRAHLNPGMTIPPETQTEPEGNDLLITIMRRYSDFELLRNYLIVKYPSYIIPPLPDKASTNYIVNKVFSSDNSEFLSQRLSFLEIFLTRIHRLTKLSKDIWFERFLFVEKWRDEVQPDYVTATNLSKAHSSSFFARAPSAPHPEMAEISTFASKSQEFLTSLLKSYERLKSTRQAMFQSTNDFGGILQNWADVDSVQSEMFQFCSGMIDTFQDALVKVEEDEEYKLLGPSKEYIAYSEAVKSAVKRQYSMAVAYEKSVETYKSKTFAKEKADKQLDEARNANKNVPKAEERQKLSVTQMDDAKTDMDDKEKAVSDFTEEFLVNYKHYQAQRKVDFKAIFLNFSRSQFLLNNSIRDSWEKIHKNFKNEAGASSHRTGTP